MTRTVVIGGVGPTLGESLARRFAQEGDQVALWARTEEFTTSLAAELNAETDGEAVAVQTDVTDPEAVEAAVAAVHEAFGAVDVYVHNTPASGWAGPKNGDPEELATMFETLGYGFALVVDELLSDLSDGGTIIHNDGESVKWISRRMAEQLAPEGIHVVHTFIDGWIDDESVSDDVPEEKRADPDEIATEFLRLVEQDRDVWTFEIDFRPWGDDAFRTRR